MFNYLKTVFKIIGPETSQYILGLEIRVIAREILHQISTRSHLIVGQLEQSPRNLLQRSSRSAISCFSLFYQSCRCSHSYLCGPIIVVVRRRHHRPPITILPLGVTYFVNFCLFHPSSVLLKLPLFRRFWDFLGYDLILGQKQTLNPGLSNSKILWITLVKPKNSQQLPDLHNVIVSLSRSFNTEWSTVDFVNTTQRWNSGHIFGLFRELWSGFSDIIIH